MLTFREIPNSEKLIAFTDAGICPHPDVDDKEAIINNAVSCMNSMGIDMPKVAVLAAAEEVNPKMPETEDAAELKRRNREGLIKDCIVEGPISLDLALEKEAAEIKGYHSPVAGDADLLVFPDLGQFLYTFNSYGLSFLVKQSKSPYALNCRSLSCLIQEICTLQNVHGIINCRLIFIIRFCVQNSCSFKSSVKAFIKHIRSFAVYKGNNTYI